MSYAEMGDVIVGQKSVLREFDGMTWAQAVAHAKQSAACRIAPGATLGVPFMFQAKPKAHPSDPIEMNDFRSGVGGSLDGEFVLTRRRFSSGDMPSLHQQNF